MKISSHSIAQLPLFPLPLVLFPSGILPLQIFEVRYLDMVKRCFNHQTPFGVVATLPAPADRKPRPVVEESRRLDDDPIEGFDPEQFVQIGCLAQIKELIRPQPGLITIAVQGGQRFEILSCSQQRFGLWVADVKLIEPDANIPVPLDLSPCSETLQYLIHNMEQQIDHLQQMPIALPYLWNDCGWLANRWCELLPVDVLQKHRLMALDNPLVRLELVSDLLEQFGVNQSQQFKSSEL